MIINKSFSSSLAKEERFGSLKSLVLLVVIAILATSNTYAQASFETIGGLSYLIYSDAKTAAITFNPSGEKYSGDIVVPEKVKASDEVEYPVTAFGDNAFDNCREFKSGKTKCARFEKRNVQKSGKTKRSKKIAHTTL